MFGPESCLRHLAMTHMITASPTLATKMMMRAMYRVSDLNFKSKELYTQW